MIVCLRYFLTQRLPERVMRFFCMWQSDTASSAPGIPVLLLCSSGGRRTSWFPKIIPPASSAAKATYLFVACELAGRLYQADVLP